MPDDGPARVERAAYDEVEQTLGVKVTPNARYADTDASMRFPDGRSGALEVTTIGDSEEGFRSEAELVRRFDHWTAPGVDWSWVVDVPVGVDLRELEDRLPTALRRCEQDDVDAYYWLDRPPQWLDWFAAQEVHLTGTPNPDHPGAIYVQLDLAASGGGPTDARPLSEWIADTLLQDSTVTEHMAKLLQEKRADERRLFVRVPEWSIGFAPNYVLSWTDYLPEQPPPVPPSLDGLWIRARLRRCTYWHRPTGWHRGDV